MAPPDRMLSFCTNWGVKAKRVACGVRRLVGAFPDQKKSGDKSPHSKNRKSEAWHRVRWFISRPQFNAARLDRMKQSPARGIRLSTPSASEGLSS